jgi:hypothetical protein
MNRVFSAAVCPYGYPGALPQAKIERRAFGAKHAGLIRPFAGALILADGLHGILPFL